jgi:hypothetical protein
MTTNQMTMYQMTIDEGIDIAIDEAIVHQDMMKSQNVVHQTMTKLTRSVVHQKFVEGSPPPPMRERAGERTSDRSDRRPYAREQRDNRETHQQSRVRSPYYTEHRRGEEKDRKRAESRTRTKSTRETTVDRGMTAEEREGVKRQMRREPEHIKIKMELVKQLEKAPVEFRNALLSTEALERRGEDAGNEGISRRENQRDALAEWKAGLSVAEYKGDIDPRDVKKLQAVRLNAAEDLKKYREGAQADADNFEAYCDLKGRIAKLNRELDVHMIVIDSLAYRIGENSLDYLAKKLPRFFK